MRPTKRKEERISSLLSCKQPGPILQGMVLCAIHQVEKGPQTTQIDCTKVVPRKGGAPYDATDSYLRYKMG